MASSPKKAVQVNVEARDVSVRFMEGLPSEGPVVHRAGQQNECPDTMF